ncbi:hypothetical protein K432DRAFT_405089 [Lepidopterella palustris CBS 459.81]|uniref:Uncharacterized protein n=1 Tax=Lepidopterella palustris CBS 459.81 TaxID=1314670 RepID=A0A8E2EAG4_9PEZI|nr:hypothetical protein K432DRAFT_405089 [Lepidopterella palustris CBS 459.81]
MLDENLPTFFLKPSPDGIKHHQSFYLTQHGSEPEAVYSFHHLDPAEHSSKNTYAAALFDSYNADILYAEVLVKPGWTQPSLSQDEIRRNGGIPPPPQPILPTEFAIQLYNPDQQVMIRQQTSKWTGNTQYEFCMPQTSFRTPSTSALDRSQNDPGADASTPKINFVWRKESKLSKDMTCFLTGKSTDPTGKKKNKEPDITIALFSGLKEITVYESNLYRVEMEDYKGLEVVLLLGAAVIRDIFFGHTKEAFHITDPGARKNSGGILGRKTSSPTAPVVAPPLPGRPTQNQSLQSSAAISGLSQPQQSRNDAQRHSLPPLQTRPNPSPSFDARKQWEIDAETARLKAQVEAEDREQRRREDLERRRRMKAEEEETRKTKKFLEAEDKERRRRQAEVDKETERLRKKYGDQSGLAPVPELPQRYSAPLLQGPFQKPSGHQHRPSGPYLQPLGGRQPQPSSSSFFGGNGQLRPDDGRKLKGGKKSFWGLRDRSESDSPATLRKKQSSMF